MLGLGTADAIRRVAHQTRELAGHTSTARPPLITFGWVSLLVGQSVLPHTPVAFLTGRKKRTNALPLAIDRKVCFLNGVRTPCAKTFYPVAFTIVVFYSSVLGQTLIRRLCLTGIARPTLFRGGFELVRNDAAKTPPFLGEENVRVAIRYVV